MERVRLSTGGTAPQTAGSAKPPTLHRRCTAICASRGQKWLGKSRPAIVGSLKQTQIGTNSSNAGARGNACSTKLPDPILAYTSAQGALKQQKLKELIMASNTPHTLATEHLPMFVSGQGETDVFFIVVVVMAIVATMSIGALYFTLHSLPERMAHKVNSNQIQLISIMLLVALFTHNNYFFIGALLLAAVRFPDWTTPLNSISKSLEEQAKKGN